MVEAVVYITTNCNLSCSHCEVALEDKSLSIKDIEHIVEDYPIDKTIVTGGEPLVHPEFEEIIEILPKPTILSNGMLVPKNVEELSSVEAVQLSIEVDKEITTDLRGEGVWEQVFESRQSLMENDISAYLRSTYCKEQLPQVAGLMESCSENDIKLVLFPRMDKPPMPTNIRVRLFDKAVETGTIISTPDFHSYIGEEGNCPAGGERIAITSSGDIIPCQFNFDYILGTIDDTWDIIKKGMKRFVRSSLLPNPCNRCEVNHSCRGCEVADTYINCPMSRGYDYTMSPSQGSMDNINETMNFLEDVGAPRGCHGC